MSQYFTTCTRCEELNIPIVDDMATEYCEDCLAVWALEDCPHLDIADMLDRSMCLDCGLEAA